MRGKAALIVGLATGYVLGTRDGRARYQQIKAQANRVMQDPRVKQKAAQAGDLAKDKAPLVKEKVAGVTQKATSKVGKGSGARSSTGSDVPPQTRTSAPDLTHSTEPAASGTSGTSGTSDEHSEDGEAIVLTPPSPSPLAPGPTQPNSSSPGAGGPNG